MQFNKVDQYGNTQTRSDTLRHDSTLDRPTTHKDHISVSHSSDTAITGSDSLNIQIEQPI